MTKIVKDRQWRGRIVVTRNQSVLVLNLDGVVTQNVSTGENILSTHAESVRTNYESHSVCEIYNFSTQ